VTGVQPQSRHGAPSESARSPWPRARSTPADPAGKLSRPFTPMKWSSMAGSMMGAREVSAAIPPIKPVLRFYPPIREAPESLSEAPWPWRVTRVRFSAAARLAGVSHSSLHRALEKRLLSCDADEKGQRWIDVSEIVRAYPDTFGSVPRNEPRHAAKQLVETALERELRERLADKDAVIADLRRRLDAEAEERRQLLVILTAIQRLLEDNTQAAASSEPSPDSQTEATHHAGERRAPWWRRWWR
jgi:hypothetical protein